jgi:hypothetical protein
MVVVTPMKWNNIWNALILSNNTESPNSIVKNSKNIMIMKISEAAKRDFSAS